MKNATSSVHNPIAQGLFLTKPSNFSLQKSLMKTSHFLKHVRRGIRQMKFYKVNIFSALTLSMTFLSEPGFLRKNKNCRCRTVQFSATALIHANVPAVLIISFEHTKKRQVLESSFDLENPERASGITSGPFRAKVFPSLSSLVTESTVHAFS